MHATAAACCNPLISEHTSTRSRRVALPATADIACDVLASTQLTPVAQVEQAALPSQHRQAAVPSFRPQVKVASPSPWQTQQVAVPSSQPAMVGHARVIRRRTAQLEKNRNGKFMYDNQALLIDSDVDPRLKRPNRPRLHVLQCPPRSVNIVEVPRMDWCIPINLID